MEPMQAEEIEQLRELIGRELGRLRSRLP